MDIKSEDINVENSNPLLVMDIKSPKYDTLHTEFYLAGGRLYYIVRNERMDKSPKPMTLADFIIEANPVTIDTMFHLRTCFILDITETKVGYLGELSAYYKDFKYTAVVLYESIYSAITVYGYSNTSYQFAFNKAKEFIESLISVCNCINCEINRGYDPLNNPIPNRLLLEIKKVIM